MFKYGSMRATVAMLMLTVAVAAMANGINGINNAMPNRISMNVTVPKQTQGSSFGEKVQSGLHAAGGAVASRTSFIIECGMSACAVALPDGSGYRAELESMTLAPLDATQVRMAAPARIRICLVFSAAEGTLRARHDSEENSIAEAN